MICLFSEKKAEECENKRKFAYLVSVLSGEKSYLAVENKVGGNYE